MELNINTNALHAHVRKLEQIKKSALPVAVRQTLNSTVFDVKQRTMPAKAAKTFEKRQPNFFKANSKVDKAQGMSISGMKATVGFVSLQGNNRAVDDLEQQEHGGNIKGRSFIPLKEARTGNSWKRNVKRTNRISDIGNKIIDSKDSSGKSDKEKYIRAALAAGKGGHVIGNRKTGAGNKTLFQIRSIVRKGRGTVVKAKPLFALKKGRVVRPKATKFMRESSMQSADKMNRFFLEHAQKQIDKLAK